MRKTCEVTVDKDEITIRTPLNKSIQEIEGILNEKIKWISQKQKEIQNVKPEIAKPIFDEQSTLPYLGKNYQLNIIHIDDKYQERIQLNDNKFTIYCNQKEIDPNTKIRSLYNDWLISQSIYLFKEKVYQFSKIMDLNPNRVVVKDLKNRWGSVTTNKTINLNVNLLKAREDMVDYIIIHELCHLKIKGHSYSFWQYLMQFVPKYKQKIEWIDRNTDS